VRCNTIIPLLNSYTYNDVKANTGKGFNDIGSKTYVLKRGMFTK